MFFAYLLLLVPVSLVLAYVVGAPPLWVFAAATLAIVPLAEWIRRATEQLARRAGSAIGGLLNLTFARERAGLLSSLLVLAMIALLLPALFDYTERGLRRPRSRHPGRAPQP